MVNRYYMPKGKCVGLVNRGIRVGGVRRELRLCLLVKGGIACNMGSRVTSFYSKELRVKEKEKEEG